MYYKWFRELSFSRLECGVHDKLHISRADCWDRRLFYFPWHRHQIEGTDGKFFIPSMIAGTLAVIGWLNRQRSLAEMRRCGYGVATNVL